MWQQPMFDIFLHVAVYSHMLIPWSILATRYPLRFVNSHTLIFFIRHSLSKSNEQRSAGVVLLQVVYKHLLLAMP